MLATANADVRSMADQAGAGRGAAGRTAATLPARNPAAFIRQQLDRFMKGYCRDHMQSQPNHVELIVEKNTIYPIVRPVVMRYGIPITSGRGYSSLDPRHHIAERYEKSGKEMLVLLFVTDFDPDGEMIAQSFARSMRDDFDIHEGDLHAAKVALTVDQVTDFDLPPGNPAKQGSSNYPAFLENYGDVIRDEQGIARSWEVEALPPETLKQLVVDAIDDVLDLDAFNAELEADREDCSFLDEARSEVHDALADLDFDTECAE